MKPKRNGFTVVELLTVVAIIAILLGVLVPSLTAVKKSAKVAQQKAQLTTISLAITAFKNDYGDYPPSSPPAGVDYTYTGAQMLTEALLGWDLLGFHPNSAWNAGGWDSTGVNGNAAYDPAGSRGTASMDERRDPYLDLATTNVFRLCSSGVGTNDGVYDRSTMEGLNPDRTFVLCDVFPQKKIRLGLGKTAMAGTPILYYKANVNSKTIDSTANNTVDLIYDVRDNYGLIEVNESLVSNGTQYHQISDRTNTPFDLLASNVDTGGNYYTSTRTT